MNDPAHILIVDDDIRICRTLRVYLKREGFQVSTATNGEGMWECFNRHHPDVVILDVMLPGTDGINLARKLRAISDVGIIMLTGKNKPIDTIIGLEIGADDYVTKPFDERQLLARIRSLYRRSRIADQQADTGTESHKFIFDGWELDLFINKLVSPSGEEVQLTSHEFKLLEILVRNPGVELSRGRILQQLSRKDWSVTDRSVDVHVGNLRKKIEEDSTTPKLILTIRNIGYKFAGHVKETG